MSFFQSFAFRTHPFLGLVALFLVVVGALLLGDFVGRAWVAWIYGLSHEELSALLLPPFDVRPLQRAILLWMQVVMSLMGFIGGCLLYWHIIEGLHWRDWFGQSAYASSTSWVAVALLFFALLPTVAFVEFWNHHIPLPEDIGVWVAQQEAHMSGITRLLTGFDTAGEAVLAILAVVLLPAVGEELLFRGVLQNRLLAALGNPHLAIWLSAFIFSFVHFQFLGFFPRWFLGALLGYIYYLSGSLPLAMWGHLVNNTVALLLLRFQQRYFPEIPLESPVEVPLLWLLVSLLSSSLLFYWFWQVSRRRHTAF